MTTTQHDTAAARAMRQLRTAFAVMTAISDPAARRDLLNEFDGQLSAMQGDLSSFRREVVRAWCDAVVDATAADAPDAEAEAVEGLSEGQLRELIRLRYERARKHGVFAKLGDVARALGKPPDARYGPKWTLVRATEQGEVSLHVDDYGGYITAHVNGRQMLSTHPANRFIIPGAWLDDLLRLHDAAQMVLARRERERDGARRRELLERVR